MPQVVLTILAGLGVAGMAYALVRFWRDLGLLRRVDNLWSRLFGNDAWNH
ncbi:hypothetical protein ACLQ24_03315 [Micromonospora sp. DT4]